MKFWYIISPGMNRKDQFTICRRNADNTVMQYLHVTQRNFNWVKPGEKFGANLKQDYNCWKSAEQAAQVLVNALEAVAAI